MDSDTNSVGASCPGGGDRDEGRCVCGRSLEMYAIHVTPTTGGQFELRVAGSDSVEYLRKMVSKRLRVPKERICLLHRDRHLRVGSLEVNGIFHGARITLLPSVETGLLTQRPEQSVMQALESLNDGQVNDFLSGKAPLNLTMRFGDHMMLIQLQLSTVSPSSSSRKSSRNSSSTSSSTHHHHYHHTTSCSSSGSTSRSSRSSNSSSPLISTTSHHHYNSQSCPNSVASATASPHRSFCSSSRSTPSSPSSHYIYDTDLPIRGCPHQSENLDPKASLDTKALAEASRNLTQTLKQLSTEVLTTKPAEKESTSTSASTSTKAASTSSSNERRKSENAQKSSSTSSSSSSGSGCSSKRQGAIIESMHHHGKGVYSGTFSGTLNPALQDRQGRPKRDISTIIHILNDLLCATPQYRRHSANATSYSVSTTPIPTQSTGSASKKQPIDPVSIGFQSRRNCENKESKLYGLSTRIPTVDNEESSSSSDDSQVTRSKLERLKFIMEQRRARRKARREARASPYSPHPAHTSWSSEATTLVASNKGSASPSLGDSAASGIDVKTEEKDSNTLCELNSGTVVA